MSHHDLVISARIESPWARALRIGLNRYGPTPIFDQLLGEHQVDQAPLSSRRRADAGTPRTVTRQPGRATASARSSSSTRAPKAAAGQGRNPKQKRTS